MATGTAGWGITNNCPILKLAIDWDGLYHGHSILALRIY